ncbi:MAG: hypothetical protein HUK21_09960 [Fibrobacteraceae bacterium]|nr:hypothetical protein [Fibrobacteraceae bacterium]
MAGKRLTVVFALMAVLLGTAPSFAADLTSTTQPNKCDSLHISTLNMTDQEIADICGIDSTKLSQGPTLQELNEEDPSYIKRDYNHRQQVIVGSVVMLCIAVAMVLMNNYNPKR